MDIAVYTLNRMLELERPNYVHVAWAERGWGFRTHAPDPYVLIGVE